MNDIRDYKPMYDYATPANVHGLLLPRSTVVSTWCHMPLTSSLGFSRSGGDVGSL